jgi:hypothetical protein
MNFGDRSSVACGVSFLAAIAVCGEFFVPIKKISAEISTP